METVWVYLEGIDRQYLDLSTGEVVSLGDTGVRGGKGAWTYFRSGHAAQKKVRVVGRFTSSGGDTEN